MAHPRTERLTRYWQQLPPGQRGSAVLVLWANAVVTVLLQGLLLVALGRTGTRLWRHGGKGALGSARGLPMCGLPVLACAVVTHQVVRWSGMHVLDRLITGYEKPALASQGSTWLS